MTTSGGSARVPHSPQQVTNWCGETPHRRQGEAAERGLALPTWTSSPLGAWPPARVRPMSAAVGLTRLGTPAGGGCAIPGAGLRSRGEARRVTRVAAPGYK